MSTLFTLPPPTPKDTIIREARITKSGERRFLLTRRWVPEEDAPYVLFVMLNPSTANAEKDDPTIRKCMKFARSWGYGALRVMNLWDKITPEPNELRTWTIEEVERMRGRVNPDVYLSILQDQSAAAAVTVCGWGAWGGWFPERVYQVMKVLTNPHALHVTKDGHPGHPLYLSADLKPQPFPDPWEL